MFCYFRKSCFPSLLVLPRFSGNNLYGCCLRREEAARALLGSALACGGEGARARVLPAQPTCPGARDLEPPVTLPEGFWITATRNGFILTLLELKAFCL